MLIIALVLQAIPQTAPLALKPGDDLDHFDLAKAKPADDDRCGIDNAGGDIVVCSRRKMMDIDTSRMPDFEEKPVRAVADLPGGGKAGIGTTSRNVGGFPSNAVMAKIKIPF